MKKKYITTLEMAKNIIEHDGYCFIPPNRYKKCKACYFKKTCTPSVSFLSKTIKFGFRFKMAEEYMFKYKLNKLRKII